MNLLFNSFNSSSNSWVSGSWRTEYSHALSKVVYICVECFCIWSLWVKDLEKPLSTPTMFFGALANWFSCCWRRGLFGCSSGGCEEILTLSFCSVFSFVPSSSFLTKLTVFWFLIYPLSYRAGVVAIDFDLDLCDGFELFLTCSLDMNSLD